MVKLTLELEDIDYDALLARFLPEAQETLRASGNPLGMLLSNGMTAQVASGILKMIPEETKDRLAADMINASADRIRDRAEKAAEEIGIRGHVHSIRADVQGR